MLSLKKILILLTILLVSSSIHAQSCERKLINSGINGSGHVQFAIDLVSPIHENLDQEAALQALLVLEKRLDCLEGDLISALKSLVCHVTALNGQGQCYGELSLSNFMMLQDLMGNLHIITTRLE